MLADSLDIVDDRKLVLVNPSFDEVVGPVSDEAVEPPIDEVVELLFDKVVEPIIDGITDSVWDESLDSIIVEEENVALGTLIAMDVLSEGNRNGGNFEAHLSAEL